jgi:Uma2 family endonuclease
MERVSVEDYLAHETKPASEYADGVVTQKSLPTRNHARIQRTVGQLIERDHPDYEALPELTVRLREGRFLVPDVAVCRRGDPSPYPTEPIPLCIEILSPGDRMSETVGKCEEYHAWGVEHAWIIDPDHRIAWSYRQGEGLRQVPDGGDLRAGGLQVNTAALFATL